MLADRLPRHVEARAEFVQRLAVIRAQPVEQFPAAGIGQGFEHLIHSHNMQPFGCLSRPKFEVGLIEQIFSEHTSAYGTRQECDRSMSALRRNADIGACPGQLPSR